MLGINRRDCATEKRNPRPRHTLRAWGNQQPAPITVRESPFRSPSKQFSDVLAHLVFPEGPIVAALGAPSVHGIANAFAGEDFGEAIGGAAVFPGAVAGDEVDVAVILLLEIPAIGEIGEVIDRIIEIKIVVVQAVHEIPEVVDAGHGEATLEDIGMLKEGVGGVIGAEGSAHGGNGDLRLAMIPDERNDLFAKVGIENGLYVAAVKRVSTFVVEAETVDGVDGIKLDAASINEISECADHALALEFEFITRTGGETEERWTPMPVSDDAKVQAEAGRVPAVVFTFHARDLSSCGKRSMPVEGKMSKARRE